VRGNGPARCMCLIGYRSSGCMINESFDPTCGKGRPVHPSDDYLLALDGGIEQRITRDMSRELRLTSCDGHPRPLFRE
jgi:hypothetical protein